MGTRVRVSPPVLRWALSRSGQSVADLQARFPRLAAWEAGVAVPTLRQLEDLSRATRTPFGFFFLDSPPAERLPVPFFRTTGGARPPRPSADLLQSVHAMQLRQTWAREYLLDRGQPPVALVGSAESDKSPTTVAQSLRAALRLDHGWAALCPNWSAALRTLRQSLEAAGVMVVVTGIVENNTRRRLDVGEFRGFVLVDEYAPLVFVNGADAKSAQMFTLAHEAAHLAFGRSAVFDLRDLQPATDPMEQLCNGVAAEFLVPERELLSFWPGVAEDEDRFGVLARLFKVSGLVAARRALDLRLVDWPAFLAFYRRVADRRAVPKADGGDFWATQGQRVGQRFGAMVAAAVREGTLAYGDAYQLTGLYGATFDRFLDRLRESSR